MKKGKIILIVVLSVLAAGAVAGGASYATSCKISGANKTNETIKGWFSTNEKGATVKVGDTKAVKMVDVSKDKGESDSWISQYKIDKLSLTKDQLVIFKIDGKEIIPGASGDGNGLAVDPTTKKLKVASSLTDAIIYLKVYKDGYDVWCSGKSVTPVAEKYTMKIGSVSYNLQKGDPQDSFMIAQYFVEVANVNSGDELTFELNGERIYPGASGELNNAIYDYETKKINIISADGYCNLYLKVYEDGYDLWADGLRDFGVKVGINSNDRVKMTPNIPFDSMQVEEYMIYLSSISKDSELIFTKNGRRIYPNVFETDGYKPFSYEEATKKLIANQDIGECNLYLKRFIDGYCISVVRSSTNV